MDALSEHGSAYETAEEDGPAQDQDVGTRRSVTPPDIREWLDDADRASPETGCLNLTPSGQSRPVSPGCMNHNADSCPTGSNPDTNVTVTCGQTPAQEASAAFDSDRESKTSRTASSSRFAETNAQTSEGSRQTHHKKKKASRSRATSRISSAGDQGSARPRKKQRKQSPEAIAVKEVIISQSDLTANQREHKKLHRKARENVPKEKLVGKNRRWIAIVNPDTKLANIRHEKDFIWMKGNRANTMRTIWQHWIRQAAASDDYKLQINDEFPSDSTIMDELNFYSDDFVVFKAVKVVSLD